MTVKYVAPSMELIVGPDASKAGELAGAMVGQRYFADDTGLYYRKSGDGASWIAEAGAAIAAGTALIGKVGIDQTTPGATDSVSVKSVAFDVATTITRPGNMTQYAANDVMGGALDLGVLGPSAKAVMITTVQLEADIAAVPGTPAQTSWELHLYSVTPPSAVADNAAFDIPAGDRASYLGFIPIPTLADKGSTLYTEISGINKQLKLAGTHLFGYLVTVSGFTPAANSEVYVVTVHTVAV